MPCQQAVLKRVAAYSLCLAATSVMAATDYIPTILAVHEAYLEKTSSSEIEALVDVMATRGLFQGSANDQILGTYCQPLLKAKIVYWNDAEVAIYANSIRAELPSASASKTLARLAKIQNARPQAVTSQGHQLPGKAQYAISFASPWAAFSHDREISSIVKAHALTKAGLAPVGTKFGDLRTAKLPVVVIMLPTPGLYMETSISSKPSVFSGAFNSSVNGWSIGGSGPQFQNNYVILAYGSLREAHLSSTATFGLTVTHEIGHYLGLPHVFVDDEDLKSSNANIVTAAQQIDSTADCAYTSQYVNNRILDVDYLRSGNVIADTVPIRRSESNPKAANIVSANCIQAYKSLINGGLVSPMSNLMNSPSRSKGKQSYGRKEGLLTPQQISAALSNLKTMKSAPSPTNLCR